MNYDEAMKAAQTGKRVALPHWHWVAVVFENGALYLKHEDEGNRPSLYRSTRNERKAIDWAIVE